ncbi:MAG TPA: 30S ribosomal protein S12 methylthiotransferase RimO, partial [Candidatus Kapabacteria bacterium]|nr:30S ribosomal protein S12 methylthiotransferase RimO [Candidatus Kapabacteria bacterium]
ITRRATEELIDTIRQKVPGIALRTTLITGYPTEGDAEFGELEEFVETMRFDRLGVFTYSVEDGTTAEPLGDTVSHDEKLHRQARLMDIQREVSYELNQEKLGKSLKVLVEREEDGSYFGRTEADAPEVDCEIKISSNNDIAIGSILEAVVTGADEFDLEGEVR